MFKNSFIKNVKVNFDELLNILLISIVLGFMFSFSILNKESTIKLFLETSFFIFIVLYLRLLFIKIFAYKNAFNIYLYLTYFDRYGFRSYDKLSYYFNKVIKLKNVRDSFIFKKQSSSNLNKGVPTYLISLILYVLTATFLIFPSIWNYKIKEIPFKFFGYKKKFEKMPFIYTNFYRFSIAIFSGYFFYVLVIIFLKFTNLFNNLRFYFSFIIFWIAFFSLIPIPGTEGFELFFKNRFLWYSAITILVSSLVFYIVDSFTIYISLICFTAIIVLFSYLWKKHS